MPGRAASASLTAAQLRFAREHAASPGKHPAREDGSVLLYNEGEHTIERWLVDRHGRIIDYARLRRT